ncbi:type-1 angiotensin II receptor [Erpetoichthys calabaricus]|uniref:type-1 angiotensin II receptor n=1 Tax=Erpetoichthys calabaricus TaxID=27687 RepID=UPI0010A02BD2|nr:type-1 angiotensin II receptor [Erpetoichthys calabaricus]
MENSSSGTGSISINCTKSGRHSYIFIMIPVVYSFIFIVGFLGNIMVVLMIYKIMKLKTVANVFMLNLALADLSFLITLPLWAAYTAMGYRWLFGSILCKLTSGLITFNLYATIFLLSGLSIDRYLAIVRPMQSRPRRTVLYARITCILIWISAFFLSLHIMCYRDAILIKNLNITVCGLYDSSKLKEIALVNGLLKSILGFFIPLIIIITCYCLIGKTLVKAYQIQKSKYQSDEVLKMLVAIVAAFFICWVPHHIFNFMDVLVHSKVIQNCHVEDIIDTAMPFTICLAFLNSCLNPILYGFVGRNFRNNMKRLVKCLPPVAKSHSSLSTKISSLSYRGSESFHLTASKQTTPIGTY